MVVSEEAYPYRNAVTPVGSPPQKPTEVGTTAPVALGIDSARLLLQAEGRRAIGRQLLRSTTRCIALAAVDVAVYLFLRAGIRLLRDAEALGREIAGAVGVIFPMGSLGGSQLITTLLFGLFVFGAYGSGDARRDPARIGRGVCAATTLTLWSQFWVREPASVFVQGIVITGVMWAFVAGGRTTVEYLVGWIFKLSFGAERVVFVGAHAGADAPWVQTGMLGVAGDRSTPWVGFISGGNGGAETTARTLARIHAALKEAGAQTIVVCGELQRPTLEAICDITSPVGLRVLMAAQTGTAFQRRVGLVWYNGSPFLDLSSIGGRGLQQLVKRVLDFTVALAGAVLLLPLWGAIAVAIKLDSPGPVFFRQGRMGYGGRTFRIWKFRTMRSTAEEEKARLSHLNTASDQRIFKIPKDPRVTRVGRILRRWSLDEFPQLINVITGEMSMVGPRPFITGDIDLHLDHHYTRLAAKPGITGLWQVSGRSTLTDFEEIIRLDREYLERWSIFLDVAILLRTVPVVLRGRGAY